MTIQDWEELTHSPWNMLAKKQADGFMYDKGMKWEELSEGELKRLGLVVEQCIVAHPILSDPFLRVMALEVHASSGCPRQSTVKYSAPADPTVLRKTITDVTDAEAPPQPKVQWKID
ncbi:hypothetical protein DXG01_002073 [Tephrocybe rancida]|nr:hypothetical protein DXG01_002073 [Tephrocybe rancida]